MAKLHLQQQFATLYQHFQGQPADTTLQHIAALWQCTKRNARMVLGKMSQAGWLSWQPVAGRGNQSALYFHSSADALQSALLHRLVNAGKLNTALMQCDNNPSLLTHSLSNLLGFGQIDDRICLQLSDFRDFPTLHPAAFLDNTARAFSQLLYQQLTKIDAATGNITGDLAYHWQQLHPLHWRFFLRPRVVMHDNSLLTESDVIDSLSALRSLPYFSHIAHLHSPAKHILDIYLCREDAHLAATLATPMAAIYRTPAVLKKAGKTDALANINSAPIGSGAWRLTVKNAYSMQFVIHCAYQGEKPLVSKLNCWIFNEKSSRYLSDFPQKKLHLPITAAAWDNPQHVADGGICLLLNQVSGVATCPIWRAFLATYCQGAALLPFLRHLAEANRLIPAHHLLANNAALGENSPPNQMQSSLQPSQPPSKGRIRLAYPENDALLQAVALGVQFLLGEQGVRVDLLERPFADINRASQSDNTDVWLQHIQLDNTPTALFAWLFSQPQLEQYIAPPQLTKLYAMLDNLRAPATGKDIAKWQQRLASQLVASQQVLPLLHMWQNSLSYNASLLGDLSGKLSEQIAACTLSLPVQQDNLIQSSVLPIAKVEITD